jgi:transcriptional regulator with XRE-family HTH domain
LISEREKIIGTRLRAFRETLQIPRARFAASIGLGSERIAAYESGRARLPYAVFRAMSKRYLISPKWLAENEGSPQVHELFDDSDFIELITRTAIFSEVYDKHLAGRLKIESDKIRDIGNEWISFAKKFFQWRRKILPFLNRDQRAKVDKIDSEIFDDFHLFESEFLKRERFNQKVQSPEAHKRIVSNECKEYIDNATDATIVGDVRVKTPTWQELKQEIIQLTSGHGKKSALANELGVSRQVLGNWLSQKGQGAPNAELTLRLLAWVTSEKSKQK